jgi:hypothetical protein
LILNSYLDATVVENLEVFYRGDLTSRAGGPCTLPPATKPTPSLFRLIPWHRREKKYLNFVARRLDSFLLFLPSSIIQTQDRTQRSTTLQVPPKLLGHLATLQTPPVIVPEFEHSKHTVDVHAKARLCRNTPPLILQHNIPVQQSKMSATVAAAAEKVSETVNDVTNALANTTLTDKSAANDAVLASAAEGRRLYIGNLAYATTEGELKDFFKGYLV